MSDNSEEKVTQGNGEQQGNPPAQLPPANTPPSNSAPPSQSANNDALVTLLTALPETIAKAVKEAMPNPAPAQSAPEKKTEEKPPAEKTEEKPPAAKDNGTPGKKSFAELWFG